MAYAFGFPRDVTKLIDSLWDWRYRLVRGGGKTPSASAMPLPVSPHAGYGPITIDLEHGKFYMQRIDFRDHVHRDWCVNINIWEGNEPRHTDYDRRRGWPIKCFENCSSKDVRPCDLAALWNTCDACEPEELQHQRTHLAHIQ